MNTRLLRPFLVICFALSCAWLAKADTILQPTFDASNQTVSPDTSDYEGTFYDFFTTFPPPTIDIGTFSYTIPVGYEITGATISGTFGDVNYPTTALTDLYVQNGTIEVGSCDFDAVTGYPPCAAGTVDGSLVTWSYTFDQSDLSLLSADFLSGSSLDFTAIQNSFGSVIVGTPTLDLTVGVPEPSTLFTLASGLLGIAALRRRK